MIQTPKVEFYGIVRNNTESYEIFKVLSNLPYFFNLKSFDTKHGTCTIFLECTASNPYNTMSVKEAIDIIMTLLQDSSNFEDVIFSVYSNLDEDLIDTVKLNITLNGIPLGLISKETSSKKLCDEWSRLNKLRDSLRLLPKDTITQLLT